MAESTLDLPLGRRADPGGGPARERTEAASGSPAGGSARSRARTTLCWGAVGALTLAFSTGLVIWARTRPSFDAYGWLSWGQMTLHGGLNTNAAPSWKPLPYLFTVLYALAGHLQLRLWMVTAATVAFAGPLFAGRLAIKLTGAPPQRRWAGWVAAAIAGAGLLGLRDELHYGYPHYILSAQSDPMIVTFVLAAIDLHLDRRHRAAFVCGLLAALGRPEAWPLLALYSLWAWRERPQMRWMLGAGWTALAALWFGIPALSSRTPFVAAANALHSGRAPSGDRLTAVIARFGGVAPWPLEAAAGLSVVLGAFGRDRRILALAAGVVVWIAIEIVFALHGWPALGRYMFEPAAIVAVLAGVFAGRMLSGGATLGGSALVGRTLDGSALVGPALVALLVTALVGPGIAALRADHQDLVQQHARAAEIAALPGVIDRLGGERRLRACGEPLTRLAYQSTLAYALGDNVSQVGFKYSQAVAHGNPVIFITPFESGVGWQVQSLHQTDPACRSLPANPTNM